MSTFLERPDDELLREMGKHGPASTMYQHCRDVLHLRSTEKLVKESHNLAEQTKKLTFWTICVALGTALLAVATWALVWVSKS